jgi:anti-anti-sigma regulatory factor
VERNPVDFPLATEAGILTVRLPRTLTVFNRHGLIEALEAHGGPFTRVRLDAAALCDVDAAGLGMMARVVRFARDGTGHPPLLRGVQDIPRSLMGSAGLLQYFEMENG